MLIWSQDAFTGSLALSLLHSLWQGALFGLAGFLFHSRCKQAAPDVRYGVYSLLLWLLFVVWLGTFGYLYASKAQPLAVSHSVLSGVVISPQFVPSSAEAEPLVMPSALHTLAPWLVAGWALGVCLLSLRHLGGFLWLCHLCRVNTTLCPPVWEERTRRMAARMGLRRHIVLRCTARIDVPCAFGLFKSTVLLPVSLFLRLPAEQAEALITHELAHIAQHDVFFHLVQVCMETILFYHPAVWWLSLQIRAAREQRCDDLAVRVVGDRTLYARALYSLEEARGTIPHLALGAKGDTSKMTNGHLIARIRRVLGAPAPEKREPWAKGVLALGAAAIGLAALMPIRAYSRPLQSDAKPATTAPAKQEAADKVQTKILLNIEGDEIEFDTTDLKADTPITVNGKMGRFGDLTPEQQKELQMVVKDIHISDGQHGLIVKINKDTDGKVVKVVKSNITLIRLNINGDKIEIKTLPLKADTPVTVNGRAGHFGDLTPTQQQQLQQAVKDIRIHDGKHRLTVKVDKGSGSTQIQLNLNGDKIALGTTDLKADTSVTVNGKTGHFGDLTAAQQQAIRDAIAKIEALHSDTSGAGLGF